jgi:hypothetical protein
LTGFALAGVLALYGALAIPETIEHDKPIRNTAGQMIGYHHGLSLAQLLCWTIAGCYWAWRRPLQPPPEGAGCVVRQLALVIGAGRAGAAARQGLGLRWDVVSTGEANAVELVVADDGSIPATQLASLGLRPGTHLRVVAAATNSGGIEAVLADFPDLSWEDFERASQLARSDLGGS